MRSGLVCRHSARTQRATWTSALTRLPRTRANEYALAFLSPEWFASRKQYSYFTGERSAMYCTTAAAAMVTMFCPAASPVRNSSVT